MGLSSPAYPKVGPGGAPCLYLQEHPNAGLVIDDFRTGDIISLTTTDGFGFKWLYVNFTLVSEATGPTPATYTVPSDGSYRLGYTTALGEHVWDCTPAAANTNIAPVASGDINLLKEDASPNSVIGNVLTNDTDADGDAVVVTALAPSRCRTASWP